jgi:hypothetical protein
MYITKKITEILPKGELYTSQYYQGFEVLTEFYLLVYNAV